MWLNRLKKVIGEEGISKLKDKTILIIGLGILDFAKAVFSGDEGEMKKSQKRFMIRLGVGILVFLIPTFVSLILKIANSIWLHINADVCLV